MWQIYCREGGVRAQTTIGKFKEIIGSDHNIELFKHGAVTYLTKSLFHQEARISNIDNTLFVKRIPFRHEMEYRFIVKPIVDTQSHVTKIKPFELFDSFLISPGMKNTEIEISKCIYNKLTRLTSSVNISQLYGSISQEHVGWVDVGTPIMDTKTDKG